jgi:hypothetical protein
MSVSAILGTVIGLVFVFALAALFCSAVTESISNIIQKRARYLLAGLRAMLDASPSPAATESTISARDGDKLHNLTRGVPSKGQRTAEHPADARKRIKQTIGTSVGDKPARQGDLAASLFAHPLINSLQTRRVGPNNSSRTIRNPQYIPPKLFAQVLIDTLLPDIQGRHRNRNVIREIGKAPDELPESFPAGKVSRRCWSRQVTTSAPSRRGSRIGTTHRWAAFPAGTSAGPR